MKIRFVRYVAAAAIFVAAAGAFADARMGHVTGNETSQPVRTFQP